MRWAHSILGCLVLVFTSQLSVRAMPPPECAAASAIRSVVESALREGGVQGALPPAGELTCPAVLSGTEKLAVASLRWDALVRAFEVRVQCKFGACLPFVVRVPLSGGAALTSNPFSRAEPEVSRFPVKVQKVAAPTPSVVRPGQTVTLLWERAGMRITRTVVCLDRGGEGQRVRTRGRDGGRIVRARVLSAGLVKADL